MNFDVVGTTRGTRVRALLCGSGFALVFGAQPALAQNSSTTGSNSQPTHHVHVVHHHVRAAAKTATPANSNSSTNQSGTNQSGTNQSGTNQSGTNQPRTNLPGTAGQSTAAPSGTPGSTAANPAGTGASAPAKTEPPPPPNLAPPNTATHNEASSTTNAPGRGTAENKPNPAAAAAPPAPPPPPPAKTSLDAAVAETFVGQPVYGSKGDKIGDLSKVETGPDGKVKSAVITWGGLFGYFQSSRTIDWAHADPVVKDGKLVLNAMTKDQVRNNEKPQASR